MGDRPPVFNGEVGDALARIQLERPYKRIGWANIQASCAAAAVFTGLRHGGLQWQVGVYLAQEKP